MLFIAVFCDGDPRQESEDWEKNAGQKTVREKSRFFPFFPSSPPNSQFCCRQKSEFCCLSLLLATFAKGSGGENQCVMKYTEGELFHRFRSDGPEGEELETTGREETCSAAWGKRFFHLLTFLCSIRFGVGKWLVSISSSSFFFFFLFFLLTKCIRTWRQTQLATPVPLLLLHKPFHSLFIRCSMLVNVSSVNSNPSSRPALTTRSLLSLNDSLFSPNTSLEARICRSFSHTSSCCVLQELTASSLQLLK